MDPSRRAAGGAASEASSAAGSDAEDDRYCSANSALATPSSLASLRPSDDLWDHQMDLLLDDRLAVSGFPKSHQLSHIQAQARPSTGPAPPAAAGDSAFARQKSSSGSPVIPPRRDSDLVPLSNYRRTDLKTMIYLMIWSKKWKRFFSIQGSPMTMDLLLIIKVTMLARLTISEMAALLPLLLVQMMPICTLLLATHQELIGWRLWGAKQRTGDVSFGEWIVGVKEYTLYLIKVRSGEDEWEIERRYCDFYAFYQQLKDLFYEKGLSLPVTWENVERKSSKVFGNASPDVVSEGSGLIQDCLHSLLVSSYPFGTPIPLVNFLSPGRPGYEYSFLKTFIPRSLQKRASDLHSRDSERNGASNDSTPMGKTISLIVEDRPQKTTRQLLELQHYNCAGCHKHLDAGRTLLQQLAQSIGWNKPLFCAYTGQLFCASCHTNDNAVLPARVLHHWDFSLYPIS